MNTWENNKCSTERLTDKKNVSYERWPEHCDIGQNGLERS